MIFISRLLVKVGVFISSIGIAIANQGNNILKKKLAVLQSEMQEDQAIDYYNRTSKLLDR